MQPTSPALTDQAGTAPVSRRRDGITLEDVQKAIDNLVRDGTPVTLRSIRGALGRTGSISTIHKHVTALRLKQAQAQEAAPSALSPQVVRALTVDIDRVVGERTARIETDLKDAQVAVELLVEENEGLRLAVTEAEVANASTRASLAEQLGTLNTLRTHAEALSEQLASSRSEAEDARRSLALSREQLRACEDRCSHLDADLRSARQEVMEIRQELADARQETEGARVSATTLQAQLVSKQHVEQYLRDGAEKGHRSLEELGLARERLSALEVERTSLAERLTETREALARAESNVQQLLTKVLTGSVRPDVGLGSPA